MSKKPSGMKKVFTEIYESKKWGVYDGKGVLSGHGSLPEVSAPWYRFLSKFCTDHMVDSIVDIGCGDFVNSSTWLAQFAETNHEIKYTGVEIYPPLVKQLRANHKKYTFMNMDAHDHREKLPEADVLIMKDVLQHWPNKNITDFISWLLDAEKYKFLLICNTCMQKCDWADVDYESGRTGRGLTFKMFPLKKFGFKYVSRWDPTGRERYKEISYLNLQKET